MCGLSSFASTFVLSCQFFKERSSTGDDHLLHLFKFAIATIDQEVVELATRLHLSSCHFVHAVKDHKHVLSIHEFSPLGKRSIPFLDAITQKIAALKLGLANRRKGTGQESIPLPTVAYSSKSCLATSSERRLSVPEVRQNEQCEILSLRLEPISANRPPGIGWRRIPGNERNVPSTCSWSVANVVLNKPVFHRFRRICCPHLRKP